MQNQAAFSKKGLAFFKAWLLTIVLTIVTAGFSLAQELSVEALPDDFNPHGRKQALALDIYRQTVHQEISHFLRKSETFRQIRRGDMDSFDVNAFDEVPDSLFFSNRQGRNKLSAEQLKLGPASNSSGGPKPGEWKVIKGKNTGLNRGIMIEDSSGAKFLLKFDPEDNIELASGAESVSSRAFYAIGYNVPEYHVVTFTRDQLKPAPDAKYYARSGFKKSLTDEGIDEILARVPQTSSGGYRASASKILEGQVLGREEFDRRRRKDPNDSLWHRDRRTFRALRVFSSWVNYYDLVPQNALDVVDEVNGKRVIKHYIIDFGSTLGSAGYLVKPDMYGYEEIFDYGEIFKSLITLGFYRKPWYNRVDQAAPEIPLASVGNFDNREFNPGKWKTQLPVYAFKELTGADAFWASKIIMQFSDDDIRTLVETGEYSDRAAVDQLSKILAERRDLIGRYWFEQTSPLTDFEVSSQGSGLAINFVDLSEKYGFVNAGDTSYEYKVFSTDSRGDKDDLLVTGTSEQSPLSIAEVQAVSTGAGIVEIRAKHGTSEKWLPPVVLEIMQGQLTGIHHE